MAKSDNVNEIDQEKASDTIIGIAAPSDETYSTYPVTITKKDGTTVEGFIDPNTHFTENGDFPVYDSVTHNRHGNLAGRVSKEELEKAKEKLPQEKAVAPEASTTPATAETSAKPEPLTSDESAKQAARLAKAAEEKAAKEKKEKEETQEKSGEGQEGGILGFIKMIVTLIGGLLTGGMLGRHEKKNGPETPEQKEQQRNQKSADELMAVAGKDHRISAQEMQRDGELSTQRAARVLGFNPDEDHNGKISDKEMGKVDAKLAAIVKTDPRVKQIAQDFHNAMDELRHSGKSLKDTEAQLTTAKESAATKGGPSVS